MVGNNLLDFRALFKSRFGEIRHASAIGHFYPQAPAHNIRLPSSVCAETK